MKKYIFIITILCFILTGMAFAVPKYIDRSDIFPAMTKFSRALGVKCRFCHVKKKSVTIKNTNKYDMKNKKEFSAMRHQRVARAMIGMERMFNKQKSTNITCVTCHKGKANPPGM